MKSQTNQFFNIWTTLAANVMLLLSVVSLTQRIEEKIFGYSVQYPHKLFYDIRAAVIGVGVTLIWAAFINRKKKLADSLEKNCSAICDNMDEAFVQCNLAGRITHANVAAKSMFVNSDLIGQDIEILMPEGFRARHHRGLIRILATGKGRIVGKTVMLSGLRSNGEEFPISLRLVQLGEDAPIAFFALIRDLSTSYIVDVKEKALPEYPSATEGKPKEIDHLADHPGE